MKEDKLKNIKPAQDTRIALKQARETIKLLEEELYETNRGMIALATELEKANESLQEEIKERKRAEEACQMVSEYNRSLIEASLDPLVTINADGKITDVNTATEKVTGYSAQELIGTDFADYFTEPEKARSGYKLVFQKGLVKNYELAIRHKDG